MSYFAQSKSEREKTNLNGVANRSNEALTSGKSSNEAVSTLGAGMVVTGNISGAGSVQILGNVTGDIQASHLVICEGARVEGKITAKETIIDGVFKGIIQGDTVKLRGSAQIDGEIFNRSLTIEENVRFEGISRRIDKSVDPRRDTKLDGEKPNLAVVPSAVAKS